MTDTTSENQPVIEAEALVARQSAEIVASGGVGIRRAPEAVLREAGDAAGALMQVLQSKKDPVMMNGERYIENDDWQVVGRFYGVTTKIESTTFRVYEIPGRDPIFGFDAAAVAIAPDGRVLTRAEMSCLSDEEKWGARPKYGWRYAKRCKQEKGRDGKWHKVVGRDGKYIVEEWFPFGHEPAGNEIVWIPNPNKEGKSMPLKERALVGTDNVPLFQMKSMAETRASSKAYRMLFAFVPIMAGFKSTPAEELDGFGADRVRNVHGDSVDTHTGEVLDERNPPPEGATPQQAQQKAAQKPAAQKTAAPAKSAQPAKGKAAPAKGKSAKPDKRTPAQKKEDARGFGEPLPSETSDASEGESEADDVFVIADVKKATKNGRTFWLITYVDRDEKEYQALTDDKDIAAVAEDAEKAPAKCRIVVKMGKLKYPEVEEIEQINES